MPARNDASSSDPGGFFRLLDQTVEDFLAAVQTGRSARIEPPKDLANVLVAGMGGSGIGGNLLADVARHEAAIPSLVVKDYRLPAYADKRTLVLAVSYSGDTEETLSVAEQALERGCRLVTISSGGQLRSLAASKGVPHIAVPAGIQPRAAMPHLFGTLLGVGLNLGLTRKPLTADQERRVRAFHADLKPQVPAPKNAARRFAEALHDKLPVLYGAGSFTGVALRGRCQLNENSKMVARNDVLPEANHNDLVGINALPRKAPLFFGFLRQSSESPAVAARFRFVEETVRSKGIATDTVTVEGETPLVRVLQGLLLVDYISLYAAQLRGVDPADVSIIGDLKRQLAGTKRVVA